MSDSRFNRKAIIAFIIVIIVLIIITLLARVNYKRSQDIYKLSSDLKIHGLVLKKPRVIKEFELTDSEGVSFSKSNLLGHWTLMFFGFTHCRSVCPTTLSALGQMLGQLKQKLPERLIPVVVMVSVDPERDTADGINQYVKSFNPDFVGVCANFKSLTKLTQQMDVSFVKAGVKGNHYMVNHSSEIMVLDPNGNLRAFFSFPHKAVTLARDYESIMKSVKVQK